MIEVELIKPWGKRPKGKVVLVDPVRADALVGAGLGEYVQKDGARTQPVTGRKPRRPVAPRPSAGTRAKS